MNGKPFARYQPSGSSVNAEQAFLCIVQATYINAVKFVIGIIIETAVDESEQKPWQHGEGEPTRRLHNGEQSEQDSDQQAVHELKGCVDCLPRHVRSAAYSRRPHARRQ